MTRTHFVNTNGLPEPDLVTTARDLGKLARAVITEYPQYASYWSMPAMHIGKRRLGSHNALLKTFPGADGLKTGFTCDSGYNVIASATRDGRRLLAVVLGETSGNERAIRSASLLEYGFQNYDWKQLFNTTSLDTLPVDPSAKGITSVRDAVAAWAAALVRHKGSGAIAHHKRRKAKTTRQSQDAAKRATARRARLSQGAERLRPAPGRRDAQDAEIGASRFTLKRELVSQTSNSSGCFVNTHPGGSRTVVRRRDDVWICPVIARRLRIGLGSSFWRRVIIVARFVLFRRVVLGEFHSGTVEHARAGPGRRVRRRECNRKSASKRRHEGKFSSLPLPLFAIRIRRTPQIRPVNHAHRQEPKPRRGHGAKIAFPKFVNRDLSLE